MNINYKEPQFELFPANSASLEDINKPKFLLATMTLTTESLVILVILGIMIALFSFSLGVERGKHLTAQALDEKVSAAWNVGARRLAVVPAVTVPQTKPQATARIAQNAPAAKQTIAKTATQAVVPAAAIVSGKWTVQISTYKNENYAKQEAIGLKAKGYPVFIIKSKEFYLVCMGQFASQEQADAFSKKIKGAKQGNQVRRI